MAVPVQLSGQILVYGQNFQFQYMLPDNATFFTNFFQTSSQRRRRTASWNERAYVYDILQQELNMWVFLWIYVSNLRQSISKPPGPSNFCSKKDTKLPQGVKKSGWRVYV